MRRTLNNIKRQQLARRQRMFLITGFSAVIMAVLLIFYLTPLATKGGLANVWQETQAKEASTSDGGESLSLGFGGDVSFVLEAEDVTKTGGADHPWGAISGLILDYDLSVINLEGPICSTGEPNQDQTSISVKNEPSNLAGMAEAGIDAVNLADDHVMDYGSAGLQETQSFLKRNQIATFGAGVNRRLAAQPALLESLDGAKVAIVGLCDVAPDSYYAGDSSAGVCEADLESVAGIIQEARKSAPYVVAFFHWGESGSTEVTQRQRDLAHASAEAGADLVVGCHPDVIQGLEIWKGVPIIYSLGNMVFYPKDEQGKKAIFAGCHFDGGSLISLEIIPLHIESARPQTASGNEAQLILEQVAKSSPGVDLAIDPRTRIAYLNL
ncbi:MAG: hypothetical protein A2Y75_00475 [Candidatus Solincola sediminis]|uniref:Capsule synthesis protein CapA domain-containing protein n=1 Tax=Candidatus Solincola sediminis TaxID=1797199 RepID=A0A1F2WQ79_9ACTN|nr:MAG: hypothetical protein A2Y75_00475 [Candidatus Solincola sediminis]